MLHRKLMMWTHTMKNMWSTSMNICIIYRRAIQSTLSIRMRSYTT